MPAISRAGRKRCAVLLGNERTLNESMPHVLRISTRAKANLRDCADRHQRDFTAQPVRPTSENLTVKLSYHLKPHEVFLYLTKLHEQTVRRFLAQIYC